MGMLWDLTLLCFQKRMGRRRKMFQIQTGLFHSLPVFWLDLTGKNWISWGGSASHRNPVVPVWSGESCHLVHELAVGTKAVTTYFSEGQHTQEGVGMSEKVARKGQRVGVKKPQFWMSCPHKMAPEVSSSLTVLFHRRHKYLAASPTQPLHSWGRGLRRGQKITLCSSYRRGALVFRLVSWRKILCSRKVPLPRSRLSTTHHTCIYRISSNPFHAEACKATCEQYRSQCSGG